MQCRAPVTDSSRRSRKTGDHLQKVPVRVLEIKAAPAVVMIDLTSLPLRRIGPVGKRPFANPAEDFVELSLADDEGHNAAG